MSPTEHSPKTPSPRTGFFALLAAFLHLNGTTTPKITDGTSTSKTGCRLALAFILVLASLAFTTAPALAATPEKPTVEVEGASITATTATFHGTLQPAATAPSEAGVYKFLYKAGSTCTGGSETAPEISMGAEAESVVEPVRSLTAGTEYTVCLVIRNSEFVPKEAQSAPVTFKTALSPEKPVTKTPAASITATTATLEGTLNPVKTEEAGTYEVYYQQSASECNPEHVAPEPAGAMSGAAKQGVSVPVTGLEPNTEYTFCLVAINKVGEVATGNAVTFKTSVSKPTVINESAEPKAAEVHLNATVNPSNETTECHFQYGTASVGEHVVECEQGNALTGGEQGVGVTVAPLKQNTVYKYQVLLKNGTGAEPGVEEKFTTAIHPETPTGLKAESITATTATLTGVLNPGATGNPGSYEFLYKNVANGAGCEGEQSSGAPALGDTPEPVKTEPGLTGLIPNTTYTFCLRAHNEVGEEATSVPVTFATPPLAPNIESESSPDVGSTEARLEATINPGNSETAYHFEYGPAAGDYTVSIPVPDGHILPGHSGLEGKNVSAAATGLQPGTTYHWRTSATNATATEYGTDQEFTTPAAQGTGSPSNCTNEQRRAEQPFAQTLPDCRAYEMVSPVDTDGQDATDSLFVGSGGPRASVSGEAVTYASKGDFADPTGDTLEDQFLSRRGPEGWSTQAITPLHQPKETQTSPSYESLAFTPELTEGIASTNAPLTSEAPVRSNNITSLWELYVDNFTDNSYQYVGSESGSYKIDTSGTSTDLSHIVFGGELGSLSESELVSEWVDGKVVPVTVANNGEPMVTFAGGGARHIASVGSASYNGAVVSTNNLWHAVSADGSRVYFTNPSWITSGSGENDPTPSVLYVRVNIGVEAKPEPEREQSKLNANQECTEPAKACTIDVSASQRSVADPHGPQSANFRGASADGSKVFFTSKAELTEGAHGQAYTGTDDNAANLYEYDLNKPEGERLTDLTVDPGDVAEGAAVQGVVQISEEGQYVYFVAKGALTGEHGEALRNASGAEPVAGEDNLYVSHEGGAPKFITTLSTTDSGNWDSDAGEYATGPESDSAVVTPDGTRLAFTSDSELTGYDNHNANNGEPDAEIYLYDSETDELACASCNPSGARPVGSSSLSSGGLAGLVLYRARNLMADGTLFFDSADALVPHASDGRQNVYEYENGHVYPISDVAGGYESFFMDASANGDNVFFGTADQLLPQDTSNNVVVYDARVGGGFPVAAAAPSCDNADSCKPPESAQPSAFAPTGSATFNGLGNLPAPPPAVVKPKPKSLTRAQKLAAALKICRKKKGKSRTGCEKQARQKYGVKKSAKRSSTDRRTH